MTCLVQYLGTYTDPDTRLPVLLMELCDESLTGFLERSPGPLSYHVQVNICQFQEECQLLSLARHPNVVQYLGTYTDPDTRLPVLLMELCDESLTGFLERSPGPLSYHVQVNICHDISLALVYLHSNGLIHRDLTGNNILMIAGSRAKITDFGMSKLATVNPRMTALTLCPGNVLYMSPEALDEAKSYTAKLDIFSFGVIIIQILTRQFPNPTDRFRLLRVPGVNEEVRVLVPDAERRKEHLELISRTNPLKPIVLQSIEKEESKRCSALELSETLSKLSSRYTESVWEAQTLGDSHRQQKNEPSLSNITPGEKLTKIIEEQQNQLTAKDEAMKMKEEKLERQGYVIELKQKELQDTKEKLQVSEKLVLELRQSLQRMEECLQQQDNTIASFLKMGKQDIQEPQASKEEQQQLPAQTMVGTAPNSIEEMAWREGRRAPEKMNRGAAIVKGKSVYIAPVNSHMIYKYRYMEGDESWFCLPNSPNKNFGLAIIEGLVTTVGGAKYRNITSSLLSLTINEERDQWLEVFPHMPTPRTNPACISTDKSLVVAGGDGLDTVEVMNMSNKQWVTVCSLPQKYSLLSGTACGDTLYLAGGIADDRKTSSKSVLTCFLSDLEPPSTLGSVLRKAITRNRNVWREIHGLPVSHSTIISFRGQLLAVGGWDDLTNPTANVYKYDLHEDSWSVVSRMKRKRSFCHAATVSQDTLIVVGGYGGTRETETDSTEILC